MLRLRAILAEQMTKCILTDVSTQFKFRLSKLVYHLSTKSQPIKSHGKKDRRELAAKSKFLARSIMLNKWNCVTDDIKDTLLHVMPSNPKKDSHDYELK